MANIREILYRTIKGDSRRTIAASLGISRTSVQKYLDIATEHYGFSRATAISAIDSIALAVSEHVYNHRQKTSNTEVVLLPFQSVIGELLKARSITHTQIQRKLRSDYQCDVHIRALNRFIKKHFPNSIPYTVHLTTLPGEEAQVDYADVGMMSGDGGKVRKTYAFVMTLSHSRHRYVEFVQSQSQQSWCRSHINAFHFFGGVPKRVLLDNLKAGVIKPDSYDPTINRAYQELAHFYHFIADPAKVRQPQQKGKVERSVVLVRQQLIAGCYYPDIRAANTAAQHWCLHEIGQRRCSTTGLTPYEAYETEEKPALLPLPEKAFDLPVWTLGRVHKDHHITLDKNFYSVPTAYIGKEVSVRMGLRTIEIFYQHQRIKAHVRCYGQGQWITDNHDYPERARQFMDKDKAWCLAKAQELGEPVHHFIRHLLDRVSLTALRKSQAVLRLVDRYGAKRLNDACLRACVYECYNYNTLEQILVKGLDRHTSRSCSMNVVDICRSAYVRPANEYSSSMEIHHGQ